MRRIGGWCLFLAFVMGILLWMEDLYQPFRLRSLKIKDFTPELELCLREWSEKFIAFHPLWLLHKRDLADLERRYPLKIQFHWAPFEGKLEVIAVPLEPVMAIHWRGEDYFLSRSGEFWPKTLTAQALTLTMPEVPGLSVGDSFPMPEERAGVREIRRTNIPASWFLAVLQYLGAVPNLRVTDVELRRRGGEDVVACTLTLDSGQQSRFLGRIGDLPQNLIAAQELLSGPVKGAHMVIDATYSDKIILRGSF